MDPRYELVVGLETHARLISKTKAFCGCANAVELNTAPNSNVCPVCMGFPGMLPVLSAGVVDLGVRVAHALRCKDIHRTSAFDRKSYFYPDLPNGFQTTQLFRPIAEHGSTKAFVNGELKEFRIRRMHLENDAGKLTHEGGKSLVDWNRAGSPLVEIVTEPDFRSKDDVLDYLRELQKNLRFCGGSDADMEKGQLRCDVNISVRKKGETEFRPRVELKNLNSFSAIGRAIDAEVTRQIDLYESGQKVDQETRGWDDADGTSHPLRSKEDAMDYRYFPEPDLPPLVISDSFVEERKISELPIDRRIKYLEQYKLLEDDARILTEIRVISDLFEKTVETSGDPKKSCSYITTVVFPILQQAFADEIQSPSHAHYESVAKILGNIIKLVNASQLSSTGAKTVISELLMPILLGTKTYSEGLEEMTVDELGLRQVSDTGALEAIADKVIAAGAAQLAQYKAGKVNLFGYFVGQCMKESAGKGNPQLFTEILKKKLS